MKFLHAADIHLDSPLLGLRARDDLPAEALRHATRRAFEAMVQLAIDEDVAFVIVAGDLYDGDWKDYSTGLFFRGQMVRLSAQGIPVYLIAGPELLRVIEAADAVRAKARADGIGLVEQFKISPR